MNCVISNKQYELYEWCCISEPICYTYISKVSREEHRVASWQHEGLRFKY